MHIEVSKKCVSWWLSVVVMLALCLLGSVKPAHAKVHIQGTVKVWRPDFNRWMPLQRARVRIVLAEDVDWDTGDVETTTDDNGFYHISKGNAWWSSGYKAYALIFAESPNKLEVQEYYGQIDGYQATTGKIFAKDDKTSTLDVNIQAPGGPAGNVSFQVGGLALLDNSSGTSGTKGWRSFFIYQSMTAHRLSLMNRSLGSGDFEEKEVSYPASVDGSTAQYTGILDYIKVEDDAFTPGLPRASLGMRHEMSHAVMADAYYIMPSTFHDSPDSHTLATVAPNRQFAWSEAWAEFLAEVSQRDAYGQGQAGGENYTSSFNDFETQTGWLPSGGKWRTGIAANAERSFIEGEIASALWDIYDGRGMEKRMNQVDAIPGEETFYDGIDDSNLAKIWGIVGEEHPHSFTHESFMGSSDSFVWYWVHKTNNGQLHELKSILFNRGIRVNEIQQSAPTMTMGKVTWNGTTASIPITVKEPNAEDRPFLKVEVFVGGQKVGSQNLNTGWNGDTNNVVLTQQIAALKANTTYPVMVAVSDDMESDWKQQTVTVPPSAVIRGIGVTLSQLRVDNFYASGPIKTRINNAKVFITVSDGKVSQDFVVPKTGTINSLKDGDTFFFPLPQQNATFNIFKSETPTGTLKVSMSLQGTAQFEVANTSQAVPVQGQTSATFSAEQAYGLGNRTMDLNLSVGTSVKTAVMDVSFNKPIRASLSYQVYAFEPNKPLNLALLGGLFTPTLTYFPLLPTNTPADTPNTKTPQTPTAMVSRANSLVKQHLRAQADLLEVAQEIEWKLSPRGLQRRVSAPARRADSADFSPRLADDPTRLLNPELLKKGAAQLTLPPTPFLDAAERGEGLVAALPASARTGLSELQTRAQEINGRLAAISTQAASLRTAMLNTATKMTAVQFGTAAKANATRSRLDDATQNLSAITSSSASFQKLGTRELSIITRGLQLPVANGGAIVGRPDTTRIPVDPGKIVRPVPPVLRNPVDSTPVKPPVITIPRRPR